MLRTKNCLKLSILLFFFLIIAYTQPVAGKPGRNPPRQPPSRDQKMHQNQNSRKPRETRPPPRIQEQQNNIKQRNIENGHEQIIGESVSLKLNEYEQDRKHKQDKYYFEEQKHKKGDQKRQSLIKLLILIIAGLITIVVVLLTKKYFRNNKSIPIQSQSTENRTNNNFSQPSIFETFQDNDKIIIKQKQTKIEIIKDIYLKKQPSQFQHQANLNFEMTVPHHDETKVGTPTFGDPSFRNQM